MVITDKQQIYELCYENVIMDHGMINLDLADYKDCQKAGEEHFAAEVYGENIGEAINHLLTETPAYNLNDAKAILAYLQIRDNNISECFAFQKWVDTMPENTTVKWGVGKLDNDNSKVRLLMFAFY